MSHDNSVTHWLDGVKAGDDADIQRLWNRYFQRLVQLASSRLPRHARRMVDEEDIAIRIAGSLEISKRTVDRKLCLIRAVWEEEPTCTPR